MAEFLFEIGLEEVPARMIAGAQAELLKRTLALLEREQLVEKGAVATSYSTPRRLAVLVSGVRVQQEDMTEEVTGPAVKIAFKEGVPTPAAEAFARKSGVAVTELRTITTPKGEYLAATSLKKGRSAAEVIAGELPKEIAAIYWAKNMYWRAGKPERFVRPVLWMVCLLGEAVVPVSFGGRTAGRATFGHRVLSSGEAFEVVSPASYLAQLEGEFVLANVEVRRQKIRKALDRVTRAVAGTRWREDHALVDQVTHLTEWPDVLLGDFEAAYLELPEEVLVTVMRDHQKYFAVESPDGKLAPHFLAVLNIALTETNGPVIKQGNERVLRARFNDARFFWEFDQRVPLIERVKLLENVTFQKELGSYAAKTERVRTLAAKLAAMVSDYPLNLAALDEAAKLAKTDLTTELVKEFTELQGVVGGLYASAGGVDRTAAEAIYDQYLPASMDDAVPRSKEGAVLGVADRLDTVVGMFGLGLEPTGSKDPFALRRAANSIVKIWVECDLTFLTVSIVSAACESPEVAAKVRAFFAERIAFYLRDVKGQTYDVVSAVMGASENDARNALLTAKAITDMRVGQNASGFLAVCAAFKRMKNILAQASAKNENAAGVVDSSLFADDSERRLYADSLAASQNVETMRVAGDRMGVLKQISELQPVIDMFFDKVMVMDPSAAVRANRLALLTQVLAGFSRIADFSEIVVAGDSL